MNKSIFINIFQIIRSTLVILAFLYFGKWLQHISHLPIPGSIFGLILLFFTLNFRLIPIHYLLPTGSFLLNYITLFFVPVGVGLLQYSELLSIHWLTIVMSSVISTIAVLISVGFIYQKLSK